MDTNSFEHAVRAANGLKDLAAAARAHGAGAILAQRVSGVFLHAAGPARQVLEAWCTNDQATLDGAIADRTLNELLRENPPEIRREVLRAFRVFVLDAGQKELARLARAAPAIDVPEWTRAFVEEWAERRGIGDCLKEPASILAALGLGATELREANRRLLEFIPIDPRAFHGFRGTDAERARYLERARNLRGPITAFLLRRLREGEQARAELAPVLTAPPPSHPGLAKLHAALHQARRGYAELLPYPLEVLRNGVVSIKVDPLEVGFRWRSEPANAPPEVIVPVPFPGDPAIPRGPTCAHHPYQSRCRHVLGAIDATLELLARPSFPPLDEIATLLSEPRWARLLKRLPGPSRAMAKKQPTAGEKLEVVWTVEDRRYGSPLLTPFAIRNGRRARLKPSELTSMAPEAVHPADRRAARALQGSMGDGAGLALQHLIGRPNVYLEEQPAPAEVVEATVGLGCEQTPKGLRLFAAIDGAEVPEYALESFSAARRGAAFETVLVDLVRNRCVLATAPPQLFDWVAAGQDLGALPEEAGALLVEQLERSGLPHRLPPSLAGERVDPSTVVEVFLSNAGADGFTVEPRVRPIPGTPPLLPGAGPTRVRGTVDGRRVHADRDLPAELRAANAVWRELGLDEPAGEQRVAGEDALALLARLQERAAGGLEVRWPGRVPKILRSPALAQVRLRVRDRKDWFGLEGEVELDGQKLQLAALLDAARRRARFVKLEDGNFAALSEELRARLEPVADLVHAGKGDGAPAEITLAAAPLLSELAKELGGFEPCASFQDLAAKARAAGEAPSAIPSGLTATLRPYQADGFRWLSGLSRWAGGACLADDMGLGKTLQALALLVERSARGPALVVAPTSVCFNWQKEAAAFAPGLRIHRYHDVSGGDRDRVLEQLGAGDVLVVSYGLLTRDAARFERRSFATLVLDEAQAIKNAHTQRARAVRELQAEFRVALTGTPLENHLGELWSLFRATFPGLLGSEERFRERFWAPIERQRDLSRRRSLAAILRPFLLRRTKAEVAKELPPRTEVNVEVALSAAERKLYEDARLAAVAELAGATAGPGEAKRFKVLAALTRLRLLACHPALEEPTWSGPASKLARLLELIEELGEEQHRALVFSQFTKHLGKVREALDARGIRYQYLDGGTPEAERRARVEAFQRGEGAVFLISLKAGGTGLNLTAADNVIHLDPWWNPAVEDQATDRAHRIGQDKPVTVYRLVTRGTIEEAILALHADKRTLVAGVLEGSDTAARMGTEELAKLLERAASEEEVGEGDDAVEADEARVVTPPGGLFAVRPAAGGEAAEASAATRQRGLFAARPGEAAEASAATPPRSLSAARPGEAAEAHVATRQTGLFAAGPAVAGEAAPRAVPSGELRSAPGRSSAAVASKRDRSRAAPATGGLALGSPDEAIRAFTAWLRAAAQRGEIGDGPVKSYPRAIQRFAEWVAASPERASQPVPELRVAYLEQLKTGAWDAPKSEPILARSALGRLVEFLREKESAIEPPGSEAEEGVG